MSRSSRSLLLAAFSLHAALAWGPAPANAGAPETSGTPPSGAEAAAERDREIRELAASLQETARKHGADAVALQAALLMSSLGAGAAGPSEVSVVGVSPEAGSEYLRIEVRTGIVFDADTTTPEDRGMTVWREVALPALGRLQSSAFRPEGLDLLLAYGTQSFAANPTASVDFDKAVRAGNVRVAIPASVLRSLVAHEIAVEELLERSEFVRERAGAGRSGSPALGESTAPTVSEPKVQALSRPGSSASPPDPPPTAR